MQPDVRRHKEEKENGKMKIEGRPRAAAGRAIGDDEMKPGEVFTALEGDSLRVCCFMKLYNVNFVDLESGMYADRNTLFRDVVVWPSAVLTLKTEED